MNTAIIEVQFNKDDLDFLDKLSIYKPTTITSDNSFKKIAEEFSTLNSADLIMDCLRHRLDREPTQEEFANTVKDYMVMEMIDVWTRYRAIAQIQSS